MPCSYPAAGHNAVLPEPLPRDLRLEAETANGSWTTVLTIADNHQRLLLLDLRTRALRLVCERPWDGAVTRLQALEVGEPALQEPAQPIPWPDPVWTGRGRA